MRTNSAGERVLINRIGLTLNHKITKKYFLIFGQIPNMLLQILLVYTDSIMYRKSSPSFSSCHSPRVSSAIHSDDDD